MTDNTQPEALRLAEQYDYGDPLAYSNIWKVMVRNELIRQHAYITDLEARLEAVGAASATSEPVAHLWQHSETGRTRVVMPDMVVDASATWLPVGPLYLHPSPPEGMVGGWIALPGTLPKPGTPVLLDIGKKYPIRAMWAAKHTVPAAGDDTDWGEYDEATDQYWCPEGWYEWNQNEDNHWKVSETPRAWMPLPPTSTEVVGHG